MSNYKTTLNLPSTEFPMRANLAVREPEILEKWEQRDLYQVMRQCRQGAPKFVIHDGPPYANGHLHCGHALNKILKDIIVKSKFLNGFDANFVPGWDCHGLPIELNVEKKIGRAGDKVSSAEFREYCANYAKEQIKIQATEAKRLGVVGHFSEPYTTMRYDYEASVVRALGKILEHGHLQQGFKPVHWCVACASALAEAEVEYEDKESPAIDVAFVLQHENPFNMDAAYQLIMPIWTTTPWTLPANEAVAVHPEHIYDFLVVDHCIYIVARPLVQSFIERIGQPEYTVSHSVVGRQFEHMLVKHPWLEKQVPIVLAEYITMDTGTGCVHTAPSHGPDDYLVGCQYHLPIDNLLTPNGCFRADQPHIANLSVWKANAVIIDLLTHAGKLLSHDTLKHSYPHCWRHKTPLIFMATRQWFVMMDTHGLRSNLLSEIKRVNWLPAWGQERMSLMVEGRPDWCLSRQRSWGTPLTLFVHKETQELHPRSLEFLEMIAQRIEESGLEAWFSLNIQEFLGGDADHYEKVSDTLDVWFDSGVSHFAVLAQKKYDLMFPADLYLEGSDQYRGWFNSSLTTAVAMGLPAPYRSVLIHGFTVDGEGKKLSKSKGNYVDLNVLIGQYGADILRLWVASTDYRYEVSISTEILQRTADAYRRIRNTARFLLSNLFDYDHVRDHVVLKDMVELDVYILGKTQQLQAEITKAYEAYQFHSIYQKIIQFCTVDLGGFYLDIIKDRQYTLAQNSVARRSCQTAMYHMLKAITLWLAPILSFTAEEIWQYIPGTTGESVFTHQWYTELPVVDGLDCAVWEKLQLLRDEVNKALEVQRQAGLIGSGLAATVCLYLDLKAHSWIQAYQHELKFLFITSACELRDIQDMKMLETLPVVESLGCYIEIQASQAIKCERCWHRHDTVGQHAQYPDLCQRCVGNMTGKDELRVKV